MVLVLDRHVEIALQNSQVTVKALGGDPKDLESDTLTSLNGNPLRSQVAYLASSGSELQMGSGKDVWRIEFDEKTNVNPVNEALLKTMISGFSKEGQDAFKDKSGL